MKLSNWLLVSWFVLATFQIACSDGTKCGPGTQAQGGTCVPVIDTCGPGTELIDGACVSSCADGQYWDGTACQTSPDCAAGTVFENGECVPACDSGQFWDGAACQDVPDCGPGTVFDQASGGCVPSDEACAPGTSLVNGECVADLICGAGTHIENGQCVPDSLGDADVFEAAVNGEPALFDVPAAGQSTSLGGLIDTPQDVNDDGYADGDWDAFEFVGQAGTWLRITAQSEGAALPAYLIDYQPVDANDERYYRRTALSPTAAIAQREIYLPYDGTYTLWLTDFNHLAAYLFNQSTLPVGGDDFSYYAEVHNLGTPNPSALVSLPHTAVDSLDDGRLVFSSLSGLANGDVIEVTAKGVASLDAETEVYPALLVFDSNNTLLGHYESTSLWEYASVLFGAASGQDYLVVEDFLLSVGPYREIDFSARLLRATDCGAVDCSSVAIDHDTSQLLAFDLAAGDFFAAGTYFPNDGNMMIHQTLLDENLEPLMEEAIVYPGQHGAAWTYSEAARTIYLWMRFGDQIDANPPPEASVDARTYATPSITQGDNSALPVWEFPPGTLYPAGIQHFSGQAGKMVFFSQLQVNGPGWNAPFEAILNTRLDRMGPVVDVNAWNFPDGFATPPFTYIPTAGHHLHMVHDNGDVAGNTFDVSMSVYETKDLGRPVVGTPVRRTLQSLTGMGFYTFEAGKNQHVQITVEPVLLSDIQPRIWVMNFGEAIWDWIYYRWIGDPNAPQLGLVVSETAPAQFENFSTGYTSPYDGMSILLVMDASGDAGAMDLFNVQVDVPAAPANDSCATAETIGLDGAGHALISASNLSATDTVSEPMCTGYMAEGPELFYRIDLDAGDVIDLIMDTDEFSPSLYLFTDCADVAGSCVAGSDQGRPEEIQYEVPAGAGGTYYIGADANTFGGAFTLDVTVNGQ